MKILPSQTTFMIWKSVRFQVVLVISRIVRVFVEMINCDSYLQLAMLHYANVRNLIDCEPRTNKRQHHFRVVNALPEIEPEKYKWLKSREIIKKNTTTKREYNFIFVTKNFSIVINYFVFICSFVRTATFSHYEMPLILPRTMANCVGVGWDLLSARW